MTILCLLNAASHAGLGLGVQQLHDQLHIRFPDLLLGNMHRTCVVDVLARAGLLEEAVPRLVRWIIVLRGLLCSELARTVDWTLASWH